MPSVVFWATEDFVLYDVKSRNMEPIVYVLAHFCYREYVIFLEKVLEVVEESYADL